METVSPVEDAARRLLDGDDPAATIGDKRSRLAKVSEELRVVEIAEFCNCRKLDYQEIERLRAELEKERARLDWFAGYGCLVVDGYLTRDLEPPVQIVNGNLRAAIDKAMDEEG